MAILRTQAELRHADHRREDLFFECGQCGRVIPLKNDGCGTGYGFKEHDNPNQKPICYACCGENDRRDMIETGKATLYLTCEPASKMRLNGHPYTPETLIQGRGRSTKGTVSNWPGTLKFECYTTVGGHNIARHRYDCWFLGPDGFRWHGVSYGDNTQICHCRRTKERIE